MATINKNTLIGVDLGGTKVAVGKIVDGTLNNTIWELIPSSSDNPNDTLDLIIDLLSKLVDDNVAGIGIGVPGMADKDGIVYDLQNIPAWKKVHLKRILEAKFNIPVFIDNDANCFALGEYRFGANAGIDDFVGLSLGTGMGAGIVKNGLLMPDASCISGEFGNIPYLKSTYEDYCSGKFFNQYYGQEGQKIAAEADLGVEWAINAFNEFGVHLGNAIKTIKFAVDPQSVIIGGSVASSRKFFEDSMWKTIRDFPYLKALEDFEVFFSETENVAVLGAASLVYENFGRTQHNKLKN
jgi:glucokinase